MVHIYCGFRLIRVCFTCSCSNVYKEAVVWEAIRAEPIVSSLKTRVEELLMEWPNHPALVQVCLCITKM